MSASATLVELGNFHLECQEKCKEWLEEQFQTQKEIRIETCADFLEDFIQIKYPLAFPVSINVNDVAAHSFPTLRGKETMKATDLIKIDFGMYHPKNGYLIDSAFSYSQDPINQSLIDISQEATDLGIHMIRVDQRLDEIGAAIQECIESHELLEHPVRSIWELSGHSIDAYRIHAGLAVPNVRLPVSMKYEKKVVGGYSYAVETFPTIGTGNLIKREVGPSQKSYMHRWCKKKTTFENEIEEFLWNTYRTFDFSMRTLFRDLQKMNQKEKFLPCLKFVESHPLIYEAYPPLWAEPYLNRKCYVAQVEKNIWIDPHTEKRIVLT